MKTLTTTLLIVLCLNLSAQSLQESLNKALKTEVEKINSFEANIDIELNAVQLKWEKPLAISVQSFVIEKSNNKEDWVELATVYGAPHVDQSVEFFHLDDSPSENISYYRLKSKCKDGAESISNIVPVNYLKNEGATAGMNLHPDFSEDYKIINIAFEEVFEKEILIVIRDKRGTEYYSKVLLNVEDDFLVAVPIDQEIPKGDYLITATSENQIFSQNVVVL